MLISVKQTRALVGLKQFQQSCWTEAISQDKVVCLTGVFVALGPAAVAPDPDLAHNHRSLFGRRGYAGIKCSLQRGSFSRNPRPRDGTLELFHAMAGSLEASGRVVGSTLPRTDACRFLP